MMLWYIKKTEACVCSVCFSPHCTATMCIPVYRHLTAHFLQSVGSRARGCSQINMQHDQPSLPCRWAATHLGCCAAVVDRLCARMCAWVNGWSEDCRSPWPHAQDRKAYGQLMGKTHSDRHVGSVLTQRSWLCEQFASIWAATAW